MRKLVHFFGLRRSGNHALINWIQKNAYSESDEGITIHHNDVFAPHNDPPRILQAQHLRIYSRSKNVLVILSYEDLPLEFTPRLPTVINQDEILENSSKHNFLLLRDPFNFSASRLQMLRTIEREGVSIAMQKQLWQDGIDLWKSYAKEFLGLTNILGDKVSINYNRWISDKTYRDALLRDNFGREENLDIGINETPLYGMGSSFDQLSYSGRATEMDILNRWQNFVHDDFYRNLFRDKEIITLSQEIFGHISGTEQLYGDFGSKERR
jgi:hypothetical protein